MKELEEALRYIATSRDHDYLYTDGERERECIGDPWCIVCKSENALKKPDQRGEGSRER